MFNKKKKNNKGFTLVELLVVIAIIGILAVVAVPSLFKNIDKANAADAIADISAIKTALSAEYAEEGNLEVHSAINNAEIESSYELEDLSDKATYSLTTTVSTATLTVTAKNDQVATEIADKWGTGAKASGSTVTITLLGK